MKKSFTELSARVALFPWLPASRKFDNDDFSLEMTQVFLYTFLSVFNGK